MNDDKNSKPTRQLVLVEWLDSQHTPKWHQEVDLNPNYELPVCYTAGFLLRETKDYVDIGQTMLFYEDVSNQICGIMTIPRGCITSMIRLRKGHAYVPPSN